MRIHFVLVRRVPPVQSPVLAEVFRLLERRGFRVTGSIPEETVVRPDGLGPEHDLYVLKSHTELALSLAGVLATQDAFFLNPYRSCAAAQDKIVVARLLRAAGLPAPRSWVTGDLGLLREVAEETPLILKPYRGHRGAGIAIVRDARELRAVPEPEAPLLVQELVEGDGEDVKVYVVGEQVFAVRKRFSATSFTRPGRPAPVSRELREIALACGRALGLGLYGLDVLETADGPVVVDVNYFPGYKGVPDIAPRIADYVERYARGRIALAPPETAGEAALAMGVGA